MSDAVHDDGSLLSQFVATGTEAPFETVVARHGALVFGVCCRVLGQTQDAEDATQAVFLTLANKAKSLRGYRSVAGWLHCVAYNISLRAREAAASRKHREREAGESGAMAATPVLADNPDWEAVKPLMDEELQALPEKYRIPLILHHVEGRTQEEIAILLGCSYGTLSGRLNRARDLLRERLMRRGVTYAPAVLFLLISQHATVAMPAALAASTVRAAALISAGHAAVPLQFSAQAKALSEGAMRTMFLAKVKIAGGIAAALVVAVSGVGFAVYSARAADSAGAPTVVSAPAPAPVASRAVSDNKPAVVKGDAAPPAAANCSNGESAPGRRQSGQRVEDHRRER
jgi:RNA polymerase sigma factor (sigma-70 family)